MKLQRYTFDGSIHFTDLALMVGTNIPMSLVSKCRRPTKWTWKWCSATLASYMFSAISYYKNSLRWFCFVVAVNFAGGRVLSLIKLYRIGVCRWRPKYWRHWAEVFCCFDWSSQVATAKNMDKI